MIIRISMFMLIRFECEEIVRHLLEKWHKIRFFLKEKDYSWRNMKISGFLFLLEPYRDELLARFSDHPGIHLDQYVLDYWKSVTIRTGDNVDLKTLHFPYTIFSLELIGFPFERMIHHLEGINRFVTLEIFIDCFYHHELSVATNFRGIEVDLMKILAKERTKGWHGVYTFADLSIKLNRTKETISDNYFKLHDFFKIRVIDNPARLGLFPALVSHSRDLTDLELQFTAFQITSRKSRKKYSLVLCPEKTTWVDQNIAEDPDFRLIGYMDFLEFNNNLTHFTPDKDSRWGLYPRLLRKVLPITPDVSFKLEKKRGDFHFSLSDLEYLEQAKLWIGRLPTASSRVKKSIREYSRRMTYLKKNAVFDTKFDFTYIGLAVEALLIAEGPSDQILAIRTNLLHFPTARVYSSPHSLAGFVLMPQKWFYGYYTEIQEIQRYESGKKPQNNDHLLIETVLKRVHNVYWNINPDYHKMIEKSSWNEDSPLEWKLL
ncbi:MAG: hypothetical protein ACFFD4_18385 [Candidatus Odinarchaeota archaeon]